MQERPRTPPPICRADRGSSGAPITRLDSCSSSRHSMLLGLVETSSACGLWSHPTSVPVVLKRPHVARVRNVKYMRIKIRHTSCCAVAMKNHEIRWRARATAPTVVSKRKPQPRQRDPSVLSLTVAPSLTGKLNLSEEG